MGKKTWFKVWCQGFRTGNALEPWHKPDQVHMTQIYSNPLNFLFLIPRHVWIIPDPNYNTPERKTWHIRIFWRSPSPKSVTTSTKWNMLVVRGCTDTPRGHPPKSRTQQVRVSLLPRVEFTHQFCMTSDCCRLLSRIVSSPVQTVSSTKRSHCFRVSELLSVLTFLIRQ
jgi:hypothetical protein